ncbi:MAG TPA: iron ABC transporter substrate-binding protein [Thermotogaceae bacterium]|nr:iron ABC transporter substrate-binding protein [Thermotogaceae bacterium]
MRARMNVLIIIIFYLGLITFGESNSNVLKITDLLGRNLMVPNDVKRVVAAGPGALRILVYLNATDRIVGVEDFEKLRPYGRPYILAHQELRDLPTIGPGGPGKLPNLEEILKLKPDVIFMTYIDARIADNIQNKVKIPVVVLSYGSLKTFEDKALFDSLKLAGKILNEGDRAERIISFIMGIQKDLENRVKDSSGPTAYVGGIGYKGLHGIDSTKPNYPIFNVLKIKNVASAIKEDHVFIDKEKLLVWQPDFIFVDEGGLNLVEKDYLENPEFYEFLNAFKEKKIYGVLPYNYYTTNIGTVLANAYFIGKIAYPEYFEDIDPIKKADEIYKFLVGESVYNEMKKQFGGFGRLDLKKGSIIPVR